MPCWEVAQLLHPVIPFSVHLSPVKSCPEIKFKNDILAVSFLMESAQHIPPCTYNCDCKRLSLTIAKKPPKIKREEITFFFRFYLFFVQYVADSIFKQYLQAEQVTKIICWRMKGSGEETAVR